MKGYVIAGLIIVVVISLTDHFYKNDDPNISKPPKQLTGEDLKVKTFMDLPQQESRPSDEEIEAAITSISEELPEGLYATFRNQTLPIPPETTIQEPMDFVRMLAYDIWYLKAIERSLNPYLGKIAEELDKAKTSEYKAIHKALQEKRGVSEEIYWQDYEAQLIREFTISAYLDEQIGTVEKLGGAEHKKAMNELMFQTFFEHKHEIKVNAKLLSY